MKSSRSNLLSQSFNDHQEDIAELLYLTSDLSRKLSSFTSQSRRFTPSVPMHSHLFLNTELQTIQSEVMLLAQQLKKSMKQYSIRTYSETHVREQRTQRMAYTERLRILISASAGLLASTQWQSPSVAESLYSQAGVRTGAIRLALNDYYRDQHSNAALYEQSFLKEYIRTPIKFPVHIFAVQSGMAAFSTILAYLTEEHLITGTVAVGSSVYFEAKERLKHLLGTSMKEVPDHDTTETLRIIQAESPSVIFLDSLGNTPEMIMPNMTLLLKSLAQTATKPVHIILDNTCMGPLYQPLRELMGASRHIRLIVYESLNKFYQFGLDRTTGGILYAIGKDTGKLFDYRVHSGTNITDVSSIILPTPRYALLKKRMLRIARNTSILSASLSEHVATSRRSPIDHIVYPALPSHPSYAWARQKEFKGAYFMISWKKSHQSIRHYKAYIARVLAGAKKENIQLTHGTSFGYSTTRIYLTALRSKTTKPFIRIAPGTEDRLTIETIRDVLIKSLPV